MTNKFIIQNKLKYIFSNNNILLNSINFCKKNNIDDKHLKYIIQSIDKFLACRDMSKGFIKFKCPLCPIIHKSPLLHVSLNFVLPKVLNLSKEEKDMLMRIRNKEISVKSFCRFMQISRSSYYKYYKNSYLD